MDSKTINLQDMQEKIYSKLNNIESALLSHKTVLTFDEVAIYSGLSKSYLYKLTSAGLIPHSKPNGKNIYFEKVIVDTWLLRNKIKTHEEQEAEAVSYVTLNKKSGGRPSANNKNRRS